MDQGSHSQVLNPKPNFQKGLLKVPSASDFSKLGILEKLALIWNFALEIRTVSANPFLLYLHGFLLRAEDRSQVAKGCKQPLKCEGETQQFQCHEGLAKGLVYNPLNQTWISTLAIFAYFTCEQVDLLEGTDRETFTKSWTWWLLDAVAGSRQ